MNFLIIKISNNKINETPVTKFIGLLPEQKIKFRKSYN